MLIVLVRYEVVATLQRGGMGEVVLADVEDDGGRRSRVVLKRLLADLLDDDRYVAMLLAEADVMSRLDHPNIVKVFDAPIVDGKQCLAMEYVHGKSAHHVARRGRSVGGMPPALAVHVMSEVLRGLEYAHRFVLEDGRPLELVHRDVTPGNVLVSFAGDVKITDFGIAKSRMSRLSTTVGVVKGTTRYLSPEQVRGGPITPRSDLFSAASVLVELLTGEPLFDRGTVPPTLFAIAAGQRRPIHELLPFSAPRLADALERALALDPEHRPASAGELRALLDAAAAEVGGPLGRDALAEHVCSLFPEEQAPLSVFESSGSHTAALDSLDLTYLLVLNDVMAAGPEVEHARRAMAEMAPGAQPLHAEEFAAEGDRDVRLVRELKRLGRIPRQVADLPGRLARAAVGARPPDTVRTARKRTARRVSRPPAPTPPRRPLGIPQFVAGALIGLACTWLGHQLHPLWAQPLPAERVSSAVVRAGPRADLERVATGTVGVSGGEVRRRAQRAR